MSPRRSALVALAVVGLVAVTSTVTSIVAVGAPATFTVVFHGVALQVPRGWTVEVEPTCTSSTTKLELASSSIAPVDTITFFRLRDSVPHTACGEHGRATFPRIGIESVAVHGLRVTIYSGLPVDHIWWTVKSRTVSIQGTGPGVREVIRTIHPVR